MIINHYITYNRFDNLTVYNKRKTCSDIITHLLKQKNFPFIYFISIFLQILQLYSLHHHHVPSPPVQKTKLQ